MEQQKNITGYTEHDPPYLELATDAGLLQRLSLGGIIQCFVVLPAALRTRDMEHGLLSHLHTGTVRPWGWLARGPACQQPQQAKLGRHNLEAALPELPAKPRPSAGAAHAHLGKDQPFPSTGCDHAHS